MLMFLLSFCLLAPGQASCLPQQPWTVAVAKAARKATGVVRVLRFQEGKHTVSTSTCFVVRKDGYILTCAHVVRRAAALKVLLPGHKEVEAEVVYYNARSDVALLRVGGFDNLPFLKLATKTPEMGEEVLVLGHPRGWRYTFARGIVSNTDSNLDTDGGGSGLTGMVQHSAAVAPGNSGGPLLNHHGEVVGMNAAMCEEVVGVAWAIPAATLRKVLAELP